MSNTRFALMMFVLALIAMESPAANAQIVVNRTDFGFTASKSFFTGAWQSGDSLSLGVPQPDSAQDFDFHSMYFDYTCVSDWHSDTTTPRGHSIYSDANDILSEIRPRNTPLDTVFTYYSFHTGASGDSLYYHGLEQQIGASFDTIVLHRPLPLLVFPLRVGARWADTTVGSVGKDRNVSISIAGTVDAFGTLHLPSGTYPALRATVVVNYTSYREYRYYYFTNDPYVTACFAVLKSNDVHQNRQYVRRATYTGPTPRYDHFVAPNVAMSVRGGTSESPIGTRDTFTIVLTNSGDTTAVIDSLTQNTSSAAFQLGALTHKTLLPSHDSITVPLIFEPTKTGTFTTAVVASDAGLQVGIFIMTTGLPKSEVIQRPLQENTIEVAAGAFRLSGEIAPFHVRIFDNMGRKVWDREGQHSEWILFPAELSSGAYFIDILSGSKQYRTKCIVLR